MTDRELIKRIKRGDPIRPEKRPEVLPQVVPYYKGKHSRYPEQVRISFKDGNTFVFEMKVEQPAPVIVEKVEIIQPVVGYPKPRRRRFWR